MLRIRFLLIKCVVLTFSVCLMTGPAIAQAAYSQLFAFGDYLSDTGDIKSANALYVIWGGSLNVRDNDSATAPAISQIRPNATPTVMVTEIGVIRI